MSLITLKTIQEKQAELAALIAQFSAPTTVRIHIPAVEIELRPGERYAGAVLDADGHLSHHLVEMAQRPTGKINWQAAMNWAASVDGDLPSPQEQALLYANCKPHLDPSWHWSNKTHEEDASYAWGCNFYDGYQDGLLKSYEGSAVAVRRV